MPPAITTTSASSAAKNPNPPPLHPNKNIYNSTKPHNLKPVASTSAAAAAAASSSNMPDPTTNTNNPNNRPSTSSSTAPSAMAIDGSEEDSILSKSEFLTRHEVLKRRARRAKQLARIYRDHYWDLMEDLRHQYREYYWKYGKSPFQEDGENHDNNNNNHNNGNIYAKGENGDSSNVGSAEDGFGGNRCGVHGCKHKAMPLTKFCHMHILSDAKQKLYKACNYAIKSSPTGPILCSKPILRSTIPSYCAPHYQKAEKHVARALKKAGLNVSSTSKLAPKFHVIVAEYVRQIQNKRRVAQTAIPENAEIKEDGSI